MGKARRGHTLLLVPPYLAFRVAKIRYEVLKTSCLRSHDFLSRSKEPEPQPRDVQLGVAKQTTRPRQEVTLYQRGCKMLKRVVAERSA
jgi:hypothetical protein